MVFALIPDSSPEILVITGEGRKGLVLGNKKLNTSRTEVAIPTKSYQTWKTMYQCSRSYLFTKRIFMKAYE